MIEVCPGWSPASRLKITRAGSPQKPHCSSSMDCTWGKSPLLPIAGATVALHSGPDMEMAASNAEAKSRGFTGLEM